MLLIIDNSCFNDNQIRTATAKGSLVILAHKNFGSRITCCAYFTSLLRIGMKLGINLIPKENKVTKINYKVDLMKSNICCFFRYECNYQCT